MQEHSRSRQAEVQERQIITRAEAKALGLKRYFTGKPCKRGHVAERYSNDQSCVSCKAEDRAANKEQNAAYFREWRKNNPSYLAPSEAPEIRRARDRAAYAKNPEAKKESARKWRKANPQKVAASIRKYYSNNKQAILKYLANKYKDNREIFLEKDREWREKMSSFIELMLSVGVKVIPIRRAFQAEIKDVCANLPKAGTLFLT